MDRIATTAKNQGLDYQKLMIFSRKIQTVAEVLKTQGAMQQMIGYTNSISLMLQNTGLLNTETANIGIINY